MNIGNVGCSLSALLLTFGLSAQTTAPDNTKTNKAIETKNAATAEDQSNEQADLEIAAKVRRAVVGDDSISTYGHNIKIIVEGGQIILKGPVQNQDEKAKIEKIAKRNAGKLKVRNELEAMAH